MHIKPERNDMERCTINRSPIILAFLLMASTCFAAAPSRDQATIPAAGLTISSPAYNADINNLYTYVQNGVDTYAAVSINNAAVATGAAIAYSKLSLTGNIVNADVSTGAAIAYSKLSLSNSILNADINSSAAIVGSKLDLTSPGAIGSTAPSTGAFTTLKVGTTNQGDILYDNGTSLVRLTPGTSGQFLKTQGAAANPIWDNTNTFKFISKTSVSSATNSGDISISASSYYFVTINMTSFSVNDSLGLLFNNDTGAHYTYVYRGFDVTATGSNGNNSGGTTYIQLGPNLVSNTANPHNYYFYIFPETGSYRSNITGKMVGTLTGGSNAVYADFMGSWINATRTSFRIITIGGATMSGDVNVYQIQQN